MHKVNAKAYYDSGEYVRAVDQARRGLELDDDDESLAQTLAGSLLMLGEPATLLEARDLCDANLAAFGTPSWKWFALDGWICQQLARVVEAAAKEPPPADGQKPSKTREKLAAESAPALRARARASLERARELSAKSESTPAEVHYNLALLDLEEGKVAQFIVDAPVAVERLRKNDRFLEAMLAKRMGERERQRTERERVINQQRGRMLCLEWAKAACAANDWKSAGEAMGLLADFGALARDDYYNRARVHEELGRIEEAAADYAAFLDRSEGVPGEAETRAVERLTRLRATLAERRTATRPPER